MHASVNLGLLALSTVLLIDNSVSWKELYNNLVQLHVLLISYQHTDIFGIVNPSLK